MIKFLWFILPLVILFYPIDRALSSLLRQSNSYPGEFEVENDIYNGDASCDIAIYGSSRAWVHIDPQILHDSLKSKAYNFGIDGHNFWLQYLRHLEFLKYNEQPKRILFSVDAFTLEKRANLFMPDQFLPFMLWNKNVTHYTSSYIGYNYFDYYVPLVRYFGKKSALTTCANVLFKKDGEKKLRHNGFAAVDAQWNSDLSKAKAEIGSLNIKLDSPSIALFENFIVECRKTNIELILVYTPEYVEGQRFIENRQEVIDLYNELAAKYNVLFLNYSGHYISFERDFFYNALHLNKKGATLFTSILARDLGRIKEH